LWIFHKDFSQCSYDKTVNKNQFDISQNALKVTSVEFRRNILVGDARTPSSRACKRAGREREGTEEKIKGIEA